MTWWQWLLMMMALGLIFVALAKIEDVLCKILHRLTEG
jgi:hypothetical protein